MNFPNSIYWRHCPLFIVYSWLLCCKLFDRICLCLFLGLLFCSTAWFCASTILFSLLRLSYVVWNERTWCLQICCSFSRLLWIVEGLSQFNTDFKTVLFLFKMPLESFSHVTVFSFLIEVLLIYNINFCCKAQWFSYIYTHTHVYIYILLKLFNSTFLSFKFYIEAYLIYIVSVSGVQWSDFCYTHTYSFIFFNWGYSCSTILYLFFCTTKWTSCV